MKGHPDGTGARKKNGPQSIGRSRGGWSTQLHRVAADARNVVTWSLTPGQAGDVPEGRRLIEQLGPHHGRSALLMDCANEDNSTRALAHSLGLIPVALPPLAWTTPGNTPQISIANVTMSSVCSGS
jgi:hypothetical protein